MNRQALVYALIIGLVVQLAMVLAGHWIALVRDNLFAIGGTVISLAAGLLYARRAGGGWSDSLIGGALVGGLCALPAIALSVALKDTAPMILALGTIASAAGGVVGGVIGKIWR